MVSCTSDSHKVCFFPLEVNNNNTWGDVIRMARCTVVEYPDQYVETIEIHSCSFVVVSALQNSWQIPYISLFARIFCDAFQLFDFHQEELEDALLSDNPEEIHPFLQELLISLLTGLTRLHVK